MRKLLIYIAVLFVLVLLGCSPKTNVPDNLKVNSVHFGTEDYQVFISVLTTKDLDLSATNLEIRVYDSLVDSNNYSSIVPLYTVSDYSINSNIIIFEITMEDYDSYQDNLYVYVITELSDNVWIDNPFMLNLYNLSKESNTRFATHIKNTIDGLLISSLNVFVNFSDYTIQSCEYSILCSIHTDYNYVTITISLQHVVLSSTFTIRVNNNTVNHVYNAQQNTVTIIMDDPNWTQPY